MKLFDQQNLSMLNGPSQFPNQLQQQDQNLSAQKRSYGNIHQFQFLGMELYSNPQFGMLCFTIILTLTLQIITLKYVFFGIHFYIGLVLCIFILYLLLSLGYSDPGFGIQQYESYQYHVDIQGCGQNCRYHRGLNLSFDNFCQKCSIKVKSQTKHCNICQTCVSQYDHHCVFIGKCVGRNNFGNFKLFLCMIFSTLIYGLVSALLSIQSIQPSNSV